MRPIALTDGQLTRLLTACAPLDVTQRPAFLEAVAAELRQHQEIGDGTIDRAIRQTQRQFWEPPNLGKDYARWR